MELLLSKRVALACLLSASLAGSAAAQEPIEDVRIEYRTAPDCPPDAWLLQRIHARTDRFRRIEDDRPARTFGIEIVQLATGYVGSLTITDAEAGARPTSRRIEAPNCSEVAEGIALIAALTIDPRANVEAKLDEPAPTKAAPPAPTAPPPVQRPAVESPEAPREPAAPGIELRVGAGFVGSHGVAPELMYGGEGFLDAAAPSEGWFAPALRLTFLRHVRRDDIAFAEGTADFRLSTMALDACPLRAPVPVLDLRLCATAEGGYLEAAGSGTDDDEQSLRGWAAVGARLRAGATLGRLGIETSFAANAPLRRDTFVFDTPRGRVAIGEVDRVVWLASAALSLRVD